MQKDANTILLFTEHRAAIDYLLDEDAGKLVKALFAYADEGILPDFNGPMMSLFTSASLLYPQEHQPSGLHHYQIEDSSIGNMQTHHQTRPLLYIAFLYRNHP